MSRRKLALLSIALKYGAVAAVAAWSWRAGIIATCYMVGTNLGEYLGVTRR